MFEYHNDVALEPGRILKTLRIGGRHMRSADLGAHVSLESVRSDYLLSSARPRTLFAWR